MSSGGSTGADSTGASSVATGGVTAADPSDTASAVVAPAPTAVTIWQRPDKPKFDGTVHQFLDMGDATTYYIGGETNGPITLAAQATKTFEAYTGGKTSGLVGDVIIADTQAGIIAEAIGLVAPNGARGELFSTSHWLTMLQSS